MDYPFPAPRWLDDIPPVVWTGLLILLFPPLLRIIFRKGPPRTWDKTLAVVGFCLAFVLMLSAGYVQQRVLTSQGYAADAVPYNFLSPWVFNLWLVVSVLNSAWLWVIFVPTVARSRKWQEGFLVYGIAALPWICLCPDVTYPREAAHRVQCRNNLAQILLGFHNYHDAYATFPALILPDTDPSRSWRVELLPYLDHKSLRDQYVDTATWDADENQPVTNYHVQYSFPYRCNSARQQTDESGRLFASYFGVRGPNTLFPDGRGMKIRDVTDGTSNTIAVVEACGVPIVWTEPRDLDLSQQQIGVNLPGDRPGESRGVVSSYHRSGGHVAMADGSVRFVSEDIDPQVLKAQLSATGGEPQDEPRTK